MDTCPAANQEELQYNPTLPNPISEKAGIKALKDCESENASNTSPTNSILACETQNEKHCTPPPMLRANLGPNESPMLFL